MNHDAHYRTTPAHALERATKHDEQVMKAKELVWMVGSLLFTYLALLMVVVATVAAVRYIVG
jgi:hypothetical protein